MKKVLLHILLLLLLLSGFDSFAQNLPKRPDPPRLVNDYTNTLSDAQQQALEQKLVALDDSTSTQIAVIIIKTLEGYDISDYNVALGRAWGIGGKEFNNGIVILIAREDRKINIATGYGLEGALPDITCKHIIEDEMLPNFRGDDYYRGIDEGIDAVTSAVKGEYQVKREHKRKNSPLAIIIIIIVIVLLSLLGGGGSGGAYSGRRGYRNFGGPVFWGGGFGGGGSSSGSGGFGGFGGGSFGGGGASGSW